MKIGDRIKQLRVSKGWTQSELAEKMGYKSKSSIAHIENGRDIPRSMVVTLAGILDTTPSYLMGWEDEKEYTSKMPSINFDNNIDETKTLTKEDIFKNLDIVKEVLAESHDNLKDIFESADSDFSQSEKNHIKKYRTLDEYGKKMVDNALDIQYERCIENSTDIKTGEKTYPVYAVAYGGGNTNTEISESDLEKAQAIIKKLLNKQKGKRR